MIWFLLGVGVLVGLLALTNVWRAEGVGRRLQVGIAVVALLEVPVGLMWIMGLLMEHGRPGPDGVSHFEPVRYLLAAFHLGAAVVGLWLGLEFLLRVILNPKAARMSARAQTAARALLVVRLAALAIPAVVSGIWMSVRFAADWDASALYPIVVLVGLPVAFPLLLLALLLRSWRRDGAASVDEGAIHA